MKTRRHAVILQLIKENDIETQEDLMRYLSNEGFAVTQATVSRDIKELRLVKSLSGNGKYRYSTVKENRTDISSKFYSLFTGSVVKIDTAQNILVIKCLTGMAQAVCASMDTLEFEGVVGTLAGDDTILCICKTNKDAENRLAEFSSFL